MIKNIIYSNFFSGAARESWHSEASSIWSPLSAKIDSDHLSELKSNSKYIYFNKGSDRKLCQTLRPTILTKYRQGHIVPNCLVYKCVIFVDGKALQKQSATDTSALNILLQRSGFFFCLYKKINKALLNSFCFIVSCIYVCCLYQTLIPSRC